MKSPMSTSSLSPLQQTVALGGNDYWNDSCSIQELTYAIANGAVGATTNPTIVLGVLKKELAVWREPLQRIIEGNPTWTEVEIAWRLTEEMAPDYVQFSIFYPFPGTDLHEHCVKNDLIDPSKLANAKDYFDDSVLKGVSLREKKESLHRRFNPRGFLFDGGSASDLEELKRVNEDLRRKLDEANRRLDRVLKVPRAAKRIVRSVARRFLRR